ncbi:MAG: CDP-glucose 4,6-dehydratase [Rhodocyclales bacterium]|nr:CDP-glucose 4,6-dehydratase [Rhodocyclales bacterium]
MTPGTGFWHGRRVFLTGHTGFKGAWLGLWLQRVGARVTAFSLAPPTQPNLFEVACVAQGMDSRHGDIRDFSALTTALAESQASVVFHLAAQATVAEGYRSARDTYATNLTGTLNLLDAIRDCRTVEAAVIVTSDKCYAPAVDDKSLDEDSPMGGLDPYSASKSSAEIAVRSWRESFFGGPEAPRIATARAGNVIGGGDWGAHRLLPDLFTAFAAGKVPSLRMPDAIRPWQHVLDALHGYLLLAEALAGKDGPRFATGWNFGPDAADELSVAEIAARAAALWGKEARIDTSAANFQKETRTLRLDSTRARRLLCWQPHWRLDQAMRRTADWYRAWSQGQDLRAISLAQLDDYLAAA